MVGTKTENGTIVLPDGEIKTTLRALRVFRVEPGATVYARILSEKYGGCYTHFHRGKSVYCAGDDCNPLIHKTERTWKGYAAIELWNDATKKWLPAVLEMTERMEQDFRHIFARGQVWELYRHERTGKKNTPCEAKLLEERDPLKLPIAFDFVPCLRALYHVERICLTTPNPLPDRVFVGESDGDAPAHLSNKPDESNILATKSMAEIQREYNERKKSPGTTQK